MISFDEFALLLDEVALDMPEEIYVRLNGGVNLLEDERVHPDSGQGAPLFVLGEYVVNSLGRYINVYYGSFMSTYSGVSLERLKAEIEHTLKHEFLHHLEDLAGERGLEVEDEVRLERYKKWFGV